MNLLGLYISSFFLSVNSHRTLAQAFAAGTSTLIQRPVMLSAVRYPLPRSSLPAPGLDSGVPVPVLLSAPGGAASVPPPARPALFPGAGMMTLPAGGLPSPFAAAVPLRVDSDGAPLIYRTSSTPGGGKLNSVSPPTVIKQLTQPLRENGVLYNGHGAVKDPLAWEEQDDPLG